MRWKSGRRSTNVDDRRGRRRGGGKMGGSLGMIVIVLVGSYFFGINPATLFQAEKVISQMLPPSSKVDKNWKPTEKQQQLADFTTVVLASTEDTWRKVFSASGKRYVDPTLVMYTDAVNSGCGSASSQMGPFYCGAGQKIYIDLSFYDDLKNKYGAGGDFAQAYVIAHEVGHHIQKIIGVSDQVGKAKRGRSKAEVNALSVRVELQADCFSGIWGYHNQDILDPGDIEEALTAASAIGDDRLQREARGRVMPESFTHGTSEQRVRWFKTGFQSGKMSDCDTFNAARL
ncbi:MAG: neutral zinc metallopeptidase [Xanthomonadales bacterium]|nr:neutral zinc metallopeptidase [Xanthomonadales bacterium]